MNTTKTGHIVVCDPDVHGKAIVIPAEWEQILRDRHPDLDDVCAWCNGLAFADDLGTVSIEWDENETFEAFADAVHAAGFDYPSALGPDDMYFTTRERE